MGIRGRRVRVLFELKCTCVVDKKTRTDPQTFAGRTWLCPNGHGMQRVLKVVSWS